ncbi:MAG: SurA N-terminal domain-containing protein [Verrucomicrobiota bacterium]
MFGTIRKHQTWLWAVIITVIIISFVIFFSPYSKMNDNRQVAANWGSINGEKVTQEEYVKAYKEICLRAFFMTGNWPDDEARKQGGDVERESFQWLLLKQKQKELGIHISTDAVAQGARAMISQFQRSGITSPEMFINLVLKPRGYEVEDLERFVRHYMGLEELIATVGLGGKLVTPQEIRDLYKRENEQLETAAVFFSASNYLASVSVAPDAVMQFYTNRQAGYRIPDRVQVSYVRFDLTNFLAEATQDLAKMTNLDLQIDEMYKQGGTNFLREWKAQTPEEARRNIRVDTLRKLQMQGARKKALEFATPLFDMDPVRTDNLDKLAKEKGLTVQITEPFDQRDGPSELAVGQDFAAKAFARTPVEPFAGPIVGMDGVYVIAFNKKIPSEIPALDKIRARVEKDYQLGQAQDLARKAGLVFYPTLTNGLAQGKTVAALCADAKLQLVDLPPISISTRELEQVSEHLPLNQFKQLAFGTTVGKVSPFQMTTAGGVIVYVKSKLPLDEAKMIAALPTFANYVRQNRQNEAFNSWFRKEAEKGLRDTPLARQEASPAMKAAPKAKKQ